MEFALVLPVLMLVLLGILDFGRAFNYWIDQTHLANEGSRYAVVNKNPGTPSITLQQYLKNQANSEELKNGGTDSVPNPLDVFICFPNGTKKVGDPVRVIVSTDYNFIPFIGDAAGVIPPIKISGSSTMRIEVSPTAPNPINYTEDGACP